jgi:hypothetical protein
MVWIGIVQCIPDYLSHKYPVFEMNFLADWSFFAMERPGSFFTAPTELLRLYFKNIFYFL